MHYEDPEAGEGNVQGLTLSAHSGLIDKHGVTAIAGPFADVGRFRSKLCKARPKRDGPVDEDEPEIWGVIDREGNWVLEPGFDEVEIVDQDLVRLTVRPRAGSGLRRIDSKAIATGLSADRRKESARSPLVLLGAAHR